ncbi:MAG: hypothetical protein ACYTEI_14625 [Planctomycetota bacterium]|jgi:hypothetical protein
MTDRMMNAFLAACLTALAAGPAPDAIDELSPVERFDLRGVRVREEQGPADARLERIKQELARMKEHDWAGCYSTAAGLTGLLLYVAPQGGVVFRHWSDRGTFDLNHGTIKEVRAFLVGDADRALG